MWQWNVSLAWRFSEEPFVIFTSLSDLHPSTAFFGSILAWLWSTCFRKSWLNKKFFPHSEHVQGPKGLCRASCLTKFPSFLKALPHVLQINSLELECTVCFLCLRRLTHWVKRFWHFKHSKVPLDKRFTAWNVLSCCQSLFLSSNTLEHKVQRQSSVTAGCICFWCLFFDDLNANTLSQTPHANGFTPLWMYLWKWRLFWSLKLLSQCMHRQRWWSLFSWQRNLLWLAKETGPEHTIKHFWHCIGPSVRKEVIIKITLRKILVMFCKRTGYLPSIFLVVSLFKMAKSHAYLSPYHTKSSIPGSIVLKER